MEFLILITILSMLGGCLAFLQNRYYRARIVELQLQKTEMAVEIANLHVRMANYKEAASIPPETKGYAQHEPHRAPVSNTPVTPTEPVNHLCDDAY